MVKKGYKETEVGIIPEDWDNITLEKLCLPNGIVRGPFGGSLKKDFFVKNGYKVYEQGNAINHTTNYGNYYINNTKYNEMKRFSIKPGDFIISCSGTIGKIFKIPENSPKGIINQALLKLSVDNRIVDSDYFFYYFSWENFNKKIIDDTQGGAMKNLVGMNIFKNTLLSMPKLLEQNAIATALSDVDNLIDNLEKLIEKKKKIKQGTMQELLTGKKRLPGFGGKGYKQTEIGMIPEDWAVQSFADTFRILNNNTFSRAELNYVSGQFRNIHYGDILIRFPEVLDCTRDDVPYINDGVRISASAQVLQNGDIVMADTAEDETVGKVTEVMNTSKKPVLSGLHTIPCRVKVGEFVPKWLGYYMNSHLYHDQLLPYIHGTKVSSVSKSSLGRTAIIVPTTEEQERIVETLSNMDEEITALNKKLAKTKLLKQGMMQKLLTGEIRLLK